MLFERSEVIISSSSRSRMEWSAAAVTSGAVRPRGALMTDGSHQSRVERRRSTAGLSLMMRAALVDHLSHC